MASLNFLRRLLALNREEPDYGPSMINVPSSLSPGGTPPFLPAGTGGTVGSVDPETGEFEEPSGAFGGPPPDFGGFGYPDPSRNEVTGTRKVPTGLGRAVSRLQSALPGVIESGIAGAAMENRAGGGPTDVLRAMAVASGTTRAREHEVLARRRQAENDERQRLKDEANIFESNERAVAAREQREAARITKETQLLKEEALAKEKKYRVLPTGQVFDEQKGEFLAQRPNGFVQIEPVEGKRMGLRPDEKGQYWIHYSRVGVDPEPKPPTVTKPPSKWLRGKDGNELLLEQLPDGTPKITDFGKLGTPPKQTAAGRSGGEKPMTRKDAGTIVVKKDAGLRKVALKYQKLHDDLDREALVTPPADLEQKRADLIQQESDEAQGVQDDFETIVSARTGKSQEPFDMAGFTSKRRRKLLADKQATKAVTQPPGGPVIQRQKSTGKFFKKYPDGRRVEATPAEVAARNAAVR